LGGDCLLILFYERFLCFALVFVPFALYNAQSIGEDICNELFAIIVTPSTAIYQGRKNE
jgi:hypothetical protein